ncbi:hypothetical protein ABI59_13555 [Acidobacteria bacterium Mor1]|nr:hypothetical protein ABI59_13555 [Acidobacteria bacterium Mor1]
MYLATARPVTLLFVLVTLPACSQHRHAATHQELSDPGVGTTDMEYVETEEPQEKPKLGGRYLSQAAPTKLRQELPEYPAAALADQVDCTAELLFHILTDGTAKVVRLEWNPAPPEQHKEAFEQAIHTAVADWEFVPGFRWIRRTDDDGQVRVEKQDIPKGRTVRIRFRVEGGKAVVE